MLDVFALTGLGWVYEKVEKRFGPLIAWVVTAALALVTLAAIAVAIL